MCEIGTEREVCVFWCIPLMIILFCLEFLCNKMPNLNSVMSENKTDRSLERMRDHVELLLRIFNKNHQRIKIS